jgi:hypothetical protein
MAVLFLATALIGLFELFDKRVNGPGARVFLLPVAHGYIGARCAALYLVNNAVF